MAWRMDLNSRFLCFYDFEVAARSRLPRDLHAFIAAGAEHVVHAHGRVGRSRIQMDHHGLAAAGDGCVANGHMDRDILMLAQDFLGVLAAMFTPPNHLFDQCEVVRSEVGKDVFDVQLHQTLQQVVRAGVQGADVMRTHVLSHRFGVWGCNNRRER